MVAILGFAKDQVTAAVQDMYAQVATDPTQHFHFPVGRAAALALGYPRAEIDMLPPTVIDRFAGVGYPFRADVIKPGDTVLDIGAGSGADALLARRRVGEAGKVWALDITPDALAQLNATLREFGIANVETIEADAETIPLPDNSVDVVTSNGALNLVPNKRRAFAEIFRVLRPDGHVQIADVVIARPVPLGGRSDPQLWAECVVGAAIDDDYVELFREAGFANVQVLNEADYFAESPSPETQRIASALGARSMEIVMRRPAKPVTPTLPARLVRRLNPKRIARIGHRGLWGAAAAALSVLACYGTIAILGLLSVLGIGVALDEGLWALTITAMAALAAIATAFNLPRHGKPWPIVMTLLAAGAIAYVMLIAYDPLLEAVGFVLLVAGVGFDINFIYQSECVPKNREDGALQGTLGRLGAGIKVTPRSFD